ncbi:transketolase [Terasakiella pusilla]|uniref:transketolase n=1 Tax=Terasakiella pusilla TaxID=64973 RepID=UPI003AA9C6FE
MLSQKSLDEKAKWVWRETLKIHRNAPETRVASSLSPIEVFVSLYYGGVLDYDPALPLWEERDRFVISKGHGSISMYPILADLGFIARDELNKVCKSGGILGGIPDPVINGYETINGSLGHGLGVSCGMAVGLRVKQSAQAVFVLVGDGELHEGACWEAIMFAGHHQLGNLNLIIDNNKISMLGYTHDIISHGDLAQRLEAFAWQVASVDGHNVDEVNKHLTAMKNDRQNGPKALICNTLKGRGVTGLENEPLSHILNPKPQILDSILAGDDD